MRREQLVRDPPHLGELHVPVAGPSGAVDDDDAVRSRLERRLEQRQRPVEPARDLLLLPRGEVHPEHDRDDRETTEGGTEHREVALGQLVGDDHEHGCGSGNHDAEPHIAPKQRLAWRSLSANRRGGSQHSSTASTCQPTFSQ